MGDYGDILQHGMASRLSSHDGLLALEQAFILPITLQALRGIGDLVLTSARMTAEPAVPFRAITTRCWQVIEFRPLPGFNWWCNMNNDQSDFHKALTQILKLTKDTCDEFATIQMDTVAWYLCRGKLMALNQVIGFFSSGDTKAFGARAGM